MPQLDAYLIVDWSASAVPKRGRDSLWIGFGRWSGRRLQMHPSSNPATRAEAFDEVRRRLQALVAEGCRVLVGFDFPYAYPRGLARALGWRPQPDAPSEWRFTWDRIGAAIQDAPDNANNRFEVASALNAEIAPRSPGPFWGVPPRWGTKTFRPTSPVFPYSLAGAEPLARQRLAERAMRARGQQVQETWKLLGRGSVGSQSLMGIPRVAALRAEPRLAPHSRVWPFETGFLAEPEPARRPFILHAEIWPRVAPFVDAPAKVKDEIQVEGLVRWLAQKDAAGELGALLAAPRGLTADALDACVREEGWIVGA